MGLPWSSRWGSCAAQGGISLAVTLPLLPVELSDYVVLHELTPHSRAALERDLVDVVIDQKPAEEIALALDALRSIADGGVPPAKAITPTIFLKENLPGAAGNGDMR